MAGDEAACAKRRAKKSAESMMGFGPGHSLPGFWLHAKLAGRLALADYFRIVVIHATLAAHGVESLLSEGDFSAKWTVSRNERGNHRSLRDIATLWSSLGVPFIAVVARLGVYV
jgi:hypothetical protein